MNNSKHILITGGAGFIGSHVVKQFIKNFPNDHIYNLDSLTYAGNLENLIEIENKPNYTFLNVDITQREILKRIFKQYKFDTIIHLAAESHVDRSIRNSLAFIHTNILGTVNLLEAAKSIWKDNLQEKLFYHISTDEVYGTLGKTGLFTETTSYSPNSPYSASKASSDHFVRAYGKTYNIPYIISNCSNNYGPNQFPEKLIPLFIYNICNNNSLPVYGDGNYIRDWIYVIDHVEAIKQIYLNGKKLETYNIGGFNEWKNIDLVYLLCEQLDEKLGRKKGESKKLIKFVKDRPGHDKRYAIDNTKIKRELNWKSSVTFHEGLSKTIDWYLKNQEWVKNVISGEYKNYYLKNYLNKEV